MAYLSAADLASISAKATPAQAADAEAVLNAYLKRPEGVLWAPDFAGAPCYMVGPSPSLTFTLPNGIAAGLNVVATVTGFVTPDLIGEVLIVDRANAQLAEALVVTAVAGQSVTFGTVQQAHAVGAVLEAGLTIREERPLASKRPVMILSRPQIARIHSAQGRYGYGRRSMQSVGLYEDVSLVATLREFGPYLWQAVDVTELSISPTTGEVWIPAGVYLSSFTDTRISYIAGFQTVPPAIKSAAAALVASALLYPQFVGNVKSFAAGGSKVERFQGMNVDGDVMQQLDPYRARLFA